MWKISAAVQETTQPGISVASKLPGSSEDAQERQQQQDPIPQTSQHDETTIEHMPDHQAKNTQGSVRHVPVQASDHPPASADVHNDPLVPPDGATSEPVGALQRQEAGHSSHAGGHQADCSMGVRASVSDDQMVRQGLTGEALATCSEKDRDRCTAIDASMPAVRTGRTLFSKKHKKRARVHVGVGVLAPACLQNQGSAGQKEDVVEDPMTLSDPLACTDTREAGS